MAKIIYPERRDDKNHVRERNRKLKALKTLVLHIIVVTAILYIAFAFILAVTYAPNDDMSPNVKAKDMLLVYRMHDSYKEQDIVWLNKNDTDYIGRVIACPGDTVDISDDSVLYINGNAVSETNIYTQTVRYEGFVEYPVQLGEDEYFILSDNRSGGEDSRYYGKVSKGELKGLVVLTVRRNRL